MQKSDNLTSHLSKDYDSQIENTIPYYGCFHEETINLIKSMNIKPSIWLDTGCGTGTLVEKALQKFPGTVFILVDPSSEMLSEALKHFMFGAWKKFLIFSGCETEFRKHQKSLIFESKEKVFR